MTAPGRAAAQAAVEPQAAGITTRGFIIIPSPGSSYLTGGSIIPIPMCPGLSI